MFDTMKVGKKISELRKKNNLTQFELADRLGISFQAVSNWERGNSMPDISKLPELADMFHTSVDDILGKTNALLMDVAYGKATDLAKYSAEELEETAQITQPEGLAALIENCQSSVQELSELLPYLGEEYIHELMDRCLAKGEDISMFLPFASIDKIDEIALERLNSDGSIHALLPYMSEDAVKAVAYDAFEKGELKEESPCLPYLNLDDIHELMEKCLAKGEDISMFLPFASIDKIDEIALERLNSDGSIHALLPYMSEDAVKAVAYDAFEKGGLKAVSPYLPFMNEDDIRCLAETFLHKGDGENHLPCE